MKQKESTSREVSVRHKGVTHQVISTDFIRDGDTLNNAIAKLCEIKELPGPSEEQDYLTTVSPLGYACPNFGFMRIFVSEILEVLIEGADKSFKAVFNRLVRDMTTVIIDGSNVANDHTNHFLVLPHVKTFIASIIKGLYNEGIVSYRIGPFTDKVVSVSENGRFYVYASDVNNKFVSLVFNYELFTAVEALHPGMQVWKIKEKKRTRKESRIPDTEVGTL